MSWDITYKKAIQLDGTLLFPERLSAEFLANAKRTQGSYIFANQYQNEIIPAGETPFKRAWLRNYDSIPSNTYTFAFIDPAISQSDSADYTALVVIRVDSDQVWHLVCANRYKITPTEIMELIFRVSNEYNPMCIGIEDVAFQKALLYMIDEEMRRRSKIIPIKGVRPSTSKTKEMRILGLVPRFEWGRILLNRGLVDFEMEYDQFPRGAHDDLLDALAYCESIVHYPQKLDNTLTKPHSPNDPTYETWYIQNLHKSREDNESEF